MIELNPLPHGLRHVLVHVTLGGAFPPPKDSPSDIALLRAANLAMQRKARGTEDAFLFVTVGQHDFELASQAVAAYGFPKVSVVCIEADDVDRRLEFGEETLPAEVDRAIEMWMNLEHIGAVARVCEEYPASEFWWTGVEQDEESFRCSFDTDQFASALPTVHHSRAGTWLSILGHLIDFEDIENENPSMLASDRQAAWAATLCGWLHGFESACGNGYNHFLEEFNPLHFFSEFYLGFELARLSGDDLNNLCDSHGVDVDDLHSIALKAITDSLRSELRDALAAFFGGDGGLYWALNSSIWPEYAKSMQATMNDLLTPTTYDEYGERDSAWRYVSEGYCEESDD